MIPAATAQQVNNNQSKGYYKDPKLMKEILESHDHVVSSNPLKQAAIFADKFQNAVTIYPAKGLAGSKNSNFYEFLTMGMVPYTIGSLMLISLFNSCTKYYKPGEQKFAGPIGHKMALGVVLYAIFKTISKKFIEWPVQLKTGVDLSMPYKTTKTELPEYKGDKLDRKAHEYHKVFESVDFPRWDLLYDMEPGKPRNAYYDKVAKKMGHGSKLVDSDQEIKPEIKQMVIRTRAATTLSSYIWAALGVGLAAQDAWLDAFKMNNAKTLGSCGATAKFLSFAYFKEIPSRIWNFSKICCERVFSKDTYERLITASKETCISLYKGGKNPSRVTSFAGKALIGAAVGSTVLGALNSMFNFYNKKSNLKEAKIDYSKGYTVD